MRRRFLWSLILLMLSELGGHKLPRRPCRHRRRPRRGLDLGADPAGLALNNPTLLAGKLNISELQAQEITAHFRPNPQLTLLADQIDPFPGAARRTDRLPICSPRPR